MRRWLGLVLLLVAPFGLALGEKLPPVDADHWPRAYDHHFRKYAKRYFGPNYDWRWFKAQGIVESGLRSRSTSRRGAQGIMQIMPATFKEIRQRNPHFVSVREPRWNIAAGIWYDRQLYRDWEAELPARGDRLAFTFASYNAGPGAVARAYKRYIRRESARSGTVWEQVARYTPKQTRHYVARIRELMGDH
jgi:membrane-bound lytic murein transglycosylase F